MDKRSNFIWDYNLFFKPEYTRLVWRHTYISVNDIELIVKFIDIDGTIYFEISNESLIGTIAVTDLHSGINIISIVDNKTGTVIDSRHIIIQ